LLAAGGNPLNINGQSAQPWTGKLVAYWDLPSTADLTDKSGNGHTLTTNGTLTNFASHPTIDAVSGGGGGGGVTAVTALGFTQGEIDVWNARRVSGPYKTAGDVSTNSPGDWDRINTNATTFDGAPTAERWTGQTRTTDCVQAADANPGFGRGIPINNAAFRSLLLDDSALRAKVVTELLFHANLPGLDFTNTTIWCPATGGHGQAIFEYAHWLNKLAVAYDFVRHEISVNDRATLDDWFTGIMNHYRLRIRSQMDSNNFFTDRYNGNWALTGNGTTKSNTILSLGENTNTHLNGYTVSDLNVWWNNRKGVCVALYGLLGVMLDNAQAIADFKTEVKESLQFATFSDGTYYEYNRWDTPPGGSPQQGMSYAGGTTFYQGLVIHFLAREGDLELLNYSTSNGAGGGGGTTSTAGGTKTFRLRVEHYLDHVDSTVTRYGTATGANDGNVAYKIGLNRYYGSPLINQDQLWHDTWQIPNNLYWRDSQIKALYMRTAAGAPAYSTSIAGGSSYYGGDSGVMPGMLFMFGQMEDNAANPFLAGSGGGARRRLSTVTDLNGQLASTTPGIANVSLGWTDPNTAEDQSEDGTAAYREIAGTFQQVGSVGPNVTQFSESFSAAAGSVQCYHVRPFYSDGLLGADPSNEWCGQMPPAPCVPKGKSGKCR